MKTLLIKAFLPPFLRIHVKGANRGLVLAVDLFQEHVLKQGPQNNESAIEQAKDEYISDCKRPPYDPT